MFIHPAAATALAEQHRQDLTTQARSHRAAGTIRRGRFAAVMAALAAAVVAVGATPALAVNHPEPAGPGGAPVPPNPVP